MLNPDGTRFADSATAPEFTIHRYRPRIEGLFARIERWTRTSNGEAHWRSISKDNITTLYGQTWDSRIVHPEDVDPRATDLAPAYMAHARIFSWLICASYDDKGNAVVYDYQPDDLARLAAGSAVTWAHERNRQRQCAPRDPAKCYEPRAANRYLKRITYGNRTPNRNADWEATDPALLDPGVHRKRRDQAARS